MLAKTKKNIPRYAKLCRLLILTSHLPRTQKFQKYLARTEVSSSVYTKLLHIMSAHASSQNDAANKLLWSNPEFAARYKTGEQLTGEYANDLCLQMGLQSYKSPVHFLDLACGTGIVSKKALAILQSSQSARPFPEDKFTFADLSSEMLKVVHSRVIAERWPISEEAKNMEVVEVNMTDTKLPPDTYTHLGCNFGPGMAPTPDHTLRESYRMLRSGGVAGWTAWQHTAWLPDMTRALEDIRDSAARRCAEGKGTDEDQKLAKIPGMMKFEDMIARFAGADLEKLRAEGVAEADLPRWDKEGWFKSRAEKAGFVDVKVSIVKKDYTLSKEDAYNMVKPMTGIISTFWTEQQRKDIEGADLQARLKEWFDQCLDVKDGKVQWNDWQAMVITAKKPQ